MAIVDDFAIDSAGAITHVSGSTNYTVLALHRWLQDLADDAQASVGDLIDITTSTPSERSTDNIITLNSPFNIDDTAAQYLYDGSISQKGGDEIYAGLVVVGAVETGTQLQIWQDEAILTSHWATGKNADAAASILNRVLVKVRTNGADIDSRKIIVWARELGNKYAEFSVTMGLGNNVAAIFTAPDLNNTDNAATISGWSDITNTEGYQLLDINGDGTTEAYYSQWAYGAKTAKQVYQRTKWIGRRGTAENLYSMGGALFRGITHEWAFINGATPTEKAVIAWGTSFAYDGGTGTVPAVGQYWRNSTSGGAGKIVYVSSGAGATGTVVIQREGTIQTWSDNDVFALLGGTGQIVIQGSVTGGTNTGGSGRILARTGTATGTVWVQLISGSAPATGYIFYERSKSGSTKVGDVNGAPTVRTVVPEFFGSYTGSSIIGAFGIGIATANGIAADLFTTLLAASANPPNNQFFTVFGLISGDRVLVANNAAGAPDMTQFATTATLNGAAVTAVPVAPAIAADTPTTGYIRIKLDTNIWRRVQYTSWTGSTFTIPSTDFTGANTSTSGKNVFIGYIDLATATTQEQVTMKYIGDRTMFVRVRDGGVTPIKTFESTANFGSGGGSATAIRTADA